MSYSVAMVGNSSSGIIEAASFQLPVVNVGERQSGRIHGDNVIDTLCSKSEIVNAIQKATSPTFIETIKGMKNPYGNGTASEAIVSCLKSLDLTESLIMKKFHSVN